MKETNSKHEDEAQQQTLTQAQKDFKHFFVRISSRLRLWTGRVASAGEQCLRLRWCSVLCWTLTIQEL